MLTCRTICFKYTYDWMNEMDISVGGVRRSLNYWLNLKSLFSSAYIKCKHFNRTLCYLQSNHSFWEIQPHQTLFTMHSCNYSIWVSYFLWTIRVIDNLLQPLMIRLRALQQTFNFLFMRQAALTMQHPERCHLMYW